MLSRSRSRIQWAGLDMMGTVPKCKKMHGHSKPQVFPAGTWILPLPQNSVQVCGTRVTGCCCSISFHLYISFDLCIFYDLHHCSDTGCCLMWMGRSSADKFFAAAGELTRLTLYLYCVTLLYFPMYLYCICVDPAGPVLESESISFLSSFFESSLHPVYSRPL